MIGKSEADTCRSQQMALLAAKRPPMGSIAHSHNMAGDARSPLELRGVLVIEVNSRMAENPHRNTPQARRHIIKFIVILLRSR